MVYGQDLTNDPDQEIHQVSNRLRNILVNYYLLLSSQCAYLLKSRSAVCHLLPGYEAPGSCAAARNSDYST